MTGCHRTGTMWAFQAAGIAPDLICTAKTLAGGVLSLAATAHLTGKSVAGFDNADPAKTFFSRAFIHKISPLASALRSRRPIWNGYCREPTHALALL